MSISTVPQRLHKPCSLALCCTCQCAGVSEGSNLRVGQAREQGDDVVHHVLVVDDAVLALPNQHLDKLAEVGAELLPHWPTHDQRVVAALLQQANEASQNQVCNHNAELKFGYGLTSRSSLGC